MGYALIVFKQILKMFIYMSIGFILYKKKLIKDEGTKALGTLLVYVIAPANILRAFLAEYTLTLLKSFGVATIISVIGILIAAIIARLLFKNDEISTLAVTYSNAGYLGIPLIEAALGFGAVIYIVPLNILVPLTQWYYSKYLLDKDNFKFDFKHIITNHIIIASIIGFLIFVLGFGTKLPSVIQDTITALTALNGPIAMILIGSYLAQTKFSDMFSGKIMTRVFARNFFIPLVTVLLFKLMPVSNEILLPLFIALSASIGANSPVYAQMYNKDYTYSCELVTMSTLVSIISLPLIMMVLS